MAQAHIAHPPPAPPVSPGVPIKRLLEIGAEQAVEVIDGEMIMMSPQKWQNTRIALDLYDALLPLVKRGNLGRLATEATYALDVDEKRRRVSGSLVPDLSFISRERYKEAMRVYGEQDFLRIVPDFAVEIVSPDDKYTVVNRKVELYLKHGAWLVWVIDPQLRNARIATPDNPGGQMVDDTAILTTDPLIAGFSISLSTLIDGAEG